MANPAINGLSLVKAIPRLIRLELVVTDTDSIAELSQHDEGTDRNDYALSALRLGLLSLRHARGQIDVESVRREGDRMLADLKQALELHRTTINQSLASSLREYFDPASGKFQDRVECLIRKDGDLEQVLRLHVGSRRFRERIECL